MYGSGIVVDVEVELGPHNNAGIAHEQTVAAHLDLAGFALVLNAVAFYYRVGAANLGIARKYDPVAFIEFDGIAHQERPHIVVIQIGMQLQTGRNLQHGLRRRSIADPCAICLRKRRT